MGKALIFLLAALLATSVDCSMAKTYATNIDGFNIQVKSDEAVNFYDQFVPAQYSDFTAYLIQMWVGNDLFETTIEDYNSSTNVSDAALVHAINTIYPLENENKKSWAYTDVGGQKGLIANVEVPASIPQYEIVYSPDASDNQGTIIVAITAYTEDKNKVEDVLKTLQIHRISN